MSQAARASADTNGATADPVAGVPVSIPATDGIPLTGSLFAPARPIATDSPIVIIAGGAAIPRRFYRHLAAYVAERGHVAVTFDVRDVGDSRSGPIARSKTLMRDWCLNDVAGVIAWAQAQHPQRPVHWLGHSMGGFATGLAHNGGTIARQLCVGTLSGYWGGMASPEKWRVVTMMGGFAPFVVATLGYMPGALLGGEDMPGPAFLEWRGWCMHPDFLFGDPDLPELARFAQFKAPIRFLQIADDPWGTPTNVASIAARFTGSVDKTIATVTAAVAGVGKIGHFGFFRPEMRRTWDEELGWLLGAPAQRQMSSVGA